MPTNVYWRDATVMTESGGEPATATFHKCPKQVLQHLHSPESVINLDGTIVKMLGKQKRRGMGRKHATVPWFMSKPVSLAAPILELNILLGHSLAPHLHSPHCLEICVASSKNAQTG